ncbi:MAG: glycosyltransferase [Phycisphaerales bacterium]|nr:glycosyltransferase [Phycisphaerales bacterium]
MKVLILADEIFAMRERSMLGRLELGLADEGIRVIHGIPATLAGHEPRDVFSRPVFYETSRFRTFRRLLARRLAETIRDPEADEDDQPVSVVHVFGGSAWELGLDVAEDLDAEAVLELWRPALRERADDIARKSAGPAPVFAVPDSMLERCVRDRSPNLTLRCTPWGVHLEDRRREILPAGGVPTAVILGGGHDRPAFAAALEGIARVLPRHRDLMIFLDARAVRRGDLWPIAKRFGLLESMSLIEDLEARRDLLTQADVLVLPEARGEHHSVVLEAMAAPMAVVAAADAAVGTLIDGRTAVLVKTVEPAAWATALQQLLVNPEQANALANSAREFVRTERTVFRHVHSVIEMYKWMTSGDSLPLRAGGGPAAPVS